MLLIQKYLEQRQSHFIKSPTLIQTLGSAFEMSLLLLWWLWVNAMQSDDAQTIFVIFSQKADYIIPGSILLIRWSLFFISAGLFFPISARSMEYVFISFGFFFPYSDFTGSFQCNLQERWENCDENAKRCINLIRSFNFVKLSSTIEANYHISWWRGWTVTYAIVRKIQFLLELQLNCSFAVWWNDFISLSDGMIFEYNANIRTQCSI